MKWEHSAGIIPFTEKRKKRKYLLLLSALTRSELWEFPKGLIEKGESAVDAASREFQEETGILEFELVPGFRKVLQYFYRRDGDLIGKRVTYFLAKIKHGQAVKISNESKSFAWWTPEEAVKNIRHKNIAQLMLEAEAFLNRTKARN